MSSSANPAGAGDDAAGHGGLGMHGGGGRSADGNGTPAGVCWTLGRESENRRKAAVVPTETDYSMDEDFNVSDEDSYRISKEIEDLRSQLTLKKKQLKCYQENKKLRVKLALKVKDAECIRKENEELKAQNKDLQENIVEISDCQIESKKRHLEQSESWKTRLELSNARLEEEIKNLYEENSEEAARMDRDRLVYQRRNVRPRNYLDPSVGEEESRDETAGASDIPERSGAAARRPRRSASSQHVQELPRGTMRIEGEADPPQEIDTDDNDEVEDENYRIDPMDAGDEEDEPVFQPPPRQQRPTIQGLSYARVTSSEVKYDNSELELASIEQQSADANVLKLLADQEREKDEVLARMLQLEKELHEKQQLELEVERLNGTLQVLTHLEGDDDEGDIHEKMEKLSERFERERKRLEDLSGDLVTKERESNDELQQARKELIKGLEEELNGRAAIGIKRMGDLDEKPFRNVCKRKYGNSEFQVKLSELVTNWQEELKNPSWHPFKMVEVNGENKEVLVDDDTKLKYLWIEYGDDVCNAVKTALLEINEYNPSGRYVVPELWNFRKGRKATMKEVLKYLFSQMDTTATKRRRG